jgi:hypothetical protein
VLRRSDRPEDRPEDRSEDGAEDQAFGRWSLGYPVGIAADGAHWLSRKVTAREHFRFNRTKVVRKRCLSVKENTDVTRIRR